MTDIMKDEVITPEERALGAFLSAMYDQRLDGAKMREAMLKVLGIAAPKALEPLTDEQVVDIAKDLRMPFNMEFVRAIEAAHGITKGTP